MFSLLQTRGIYFALLLVVTVVDSNEPPPSVWVQCLSGTMSSDVITANFGLCAEAKCRDIADGTPRIWTHCVEADDSFIEAFRTFRSNEEADKCAAIRKLAQTGTNVDACQSNPCKNGGQCATFSHGHGHEHGDEYRCICYPGYIGKNCEVQETNPCDSSPCKTEEQCLRNPQLPKGFKCICHHGFRGSKCKTDSSLPGCNSQPCLHGGYCIDKPSAPQGFLCNCRSEYRGRMCEEAVTPPINCTWFPSGVYADPVKCPSDSFYKCENGRGWLFRCDIHTFFNPKSKTCTWK